MNDHNTWMYLTGRMISLMDREAVATSERYRESLNAQMDAIGDQLRRLNYDFYTGKRRKAPREFAQKCRDEDVPCLFKRANPVLGKDCFVMHPERVHEYCLKEAQRGK